MTVLVRDGFGNELVGLVRHAEDDAGAVEPGTPCPLALVAVTSGGAVLLVHERRRGGWELPGGMREAGESVRRAAERELAEETGLTAPALVFVGTATFVLGRPRRREHGAMFRAPLAEGDRPDLTSFQPTEEIAAVTWWDPARAPGGVPGSVPTAPIDAWLARALLEAP